MSSPQGYPVTEVPLYALHSITEKVILDWSFGHWSLHVSGKPFLVGYNRSSIAACTPIPRQELK